MLTSCWKEWMTDTLSIHLPGAQTIINRILCMKFCPLYTEIPLWHPHHQELYIKSWMPFSRVKGFILLDLKNTYGQGLVEENMWRHLCVTHVDDCLLSCKSKDIMTAFKKEILARFVGTDEGEVTEYLAWMRAPWMRADSTAIRDRLTQKGYAECVLKTFGMFTK